MTFYDVGYRSCRRIWHLLDTSGQRLSLSLSGWVHTIFPAKKKTPIVYGLSSAVFLTAFRLHLYNNLNTLLALQSNTPEEAQPLTWQQFFKSDRSLQLLGCELCFPCRHHTHCRIFQGLSGLISAAGQWSMRTRDPTGVMGKTGLFTLHFLQGLSGTLIYTLLVFTIGFLFGACLGPRTVAHFILKHSMHFNA